MKIPPKLRPGSGVRVVAPACSMSSMKWITPDYLKTAEKKMAEWGLTVSYGKHIWEIDDFDSSSIASRVEDIHEAFRDPSINLVHCARGGFNCNQLLPYLDYDLIGKNPKILLGFSDITALSNAIFAKTGLVTYSGPSFYQFGFGEQLGYTFEYLKKCVIDDAPFTLEPSASWSDGHFTPDAPDLPFEKNEGYWTLQEGEAKGTLIGGNACTFNFLQGTEYFPPLAGSILCVEDDYESVPHHFDTHLQAILHQPGAGGIGGVLIGRFQKATKMTRTLLTQIIATKRELKGIPVIANVDFGHTHPMITFPIGGTAKIRVHKDSAEIKILQH